MLKRYAREEMEKIWTLESRFGFMLEVEKAVAVVQGNLKLIPIESAKAIENKGSFSVENILKKEKITRHDVTAFVQEVAEQVGEPHGSFVHWGLTSSDVLDTALALQIRQASEVLKKSFTVLKETLCFQVKNHADTLCAGRTHGMLAEPLTFGLKLLSYLMELKRNEDRVARAGGQCLVGKLSGAVGAYGTLSPVVEQKVCESLGLMVEPVATQVVPRDRYAELILALAMTASGLERLAVEIRHLHRTEVRELSENFTSGQTGSSAMPHKKNPIYSENITGLSRLLRSYVSPALENIILWHERDISHSSVERVIFPSAFILCDFALNRMAEVVRGLVIDKEKMQTNMEVGGGVIFSSILLTELVKKGLSRASAYKLIQTVTQSLKPGESLKENLSENKQTEKYFNSEELNKIFSIEERKKEIGFRVRDILKKEFL